MDILTVVIILFIVLESLNVFMLYVVPGTKKGNGMGAFTVWESSKENPEVHRLLKYLVNWVAGTKIIFIGLLLVIIIEGSMELKSMAVAVLILTIAIFYWRLYPLMKVMDSKDEIEPKGYSKTLARMIGVFILVFAVALTISL